MLSFEKSHNIFSFSQVMNENILFNAAPPAMDVNVVRAIDVKQ